MVPLPPFWGKGLGDGGRVLSNSRLARGVKPNGTDIRLVGSAHPTVYQYFQRSQFAYVSAFGVKPGFELETEMWHG
ncbi:MAG: hypothetical protein F6K30_15735 [Cyanothece sp. SIO2G6]|nr:hypothetical protein [Cyanothece sp. SIO2G6]